MSSMLGRQASQQRRQSVMTCPWAGNVLPPRTMEALVSNLDDNGSGRFSTEVVNSAISLFNSLDNLSHINGGKVPVPSGDQRPQMDFCVGSSDGTVDKAEITRVMSKFADGPLKTTVHHVVHVFQELIEIEWLFTTWAGAKTAVLTHDETIAPLKAFNKWANPRHDPTEEGLMMMSYYDRSMYGGSELSFVAFTRWIWEELSVLEENFAEPFEVTLGKLSECVETAKNGADQVSYIQRAKERCPWSGTLLPPRTLGAFLAHYTKDANGFYNKDDINSAIDIFNGLDNLEHLLGGNGKFDTDNPPKVSLCSAGQDGKVSQSDVEKVLREFADRYLSGSLPQLVHSFQELQEIDWLFLTWSGNNEGSLKLAAVQMAVKNFNKWSMPRHDLDPRGLMVMNNYDVLLYGHDITLASFTRWVFEELSTLEEIFQEPFEVMLQVLSDCMQASKVMSCFQSWDTVGANNIEYEALLTVVGELVGDDAAPSEIRKLLDKVASKDGVVDYRKFVEVVMLHHLRP